MSTDLATIDPKVLAIIKGSFDPGGMPLPFVREIFLLECHIAGTGYLDLSEIEPLLRDGDAFVFRREPENPHDELAILIFHKLGYKLGYVPRDRNEVLARLMDAGKLIFDKLESKEWLNDWLCLGIRIYLREI